MELNAHDLGFPSAHLWRTESAFDPEAIKLMSNALEDACAALARSGVIDAKALRDRVVAEAKALRSL